MNSLCHSPSFALCSSPVPSGQQRSSNAEHLQVCSLHEPGRAPSSFLSLTRQCSPRGQGLAWGCFLMEMGGRAGAAAKSHFLQPPPPFLPSSSQGPVQALTSSFPPPGLLALGPLLWLQALQGFFTQQGRQAQTYHCPPWTLLAIGASPQDLMAATGTSLLTPQRLALSRPGPCRGQTRHLCPTPQMLPQASWNHSGSHIAFLSGPRSPTSLYSSAVWGAEPHGVGVSVQCPRPPATSSCSNFGVCNTVN